MPTTTAGPMNSTAHAINVGACGLVLMALLLLPPIAYAQHEADKATLFLAHFDRTTNADVARGRGKALEGGGDITFGRAGRFGEALRLGSRRRLVFAAKGNLNPKQGTIEFWFCLEQPPPQKYQFFNFRGGEHNYMNINRIQPGRLGAALCGGPPDDWTWKRVDYRKKDIVPGRWHHLAVTWGGTELSLYIDGNLIGSTSEAKMPTGPVKEFTILGIPGLIDEFRISSCKRTAEEIKASAEGAGRANPASGLVFLTDHQPTSARQAWGKAGVDGRYPYELRVPLVMDGKIYPRGVGTEGDAKMVFDVPDGFDRLVATIGLSDFGAGPANAVVRVTGGDRTLLEKHPAAAGKPGRVTIPLEGAKQIELISEGGDRHGLGAWVDWGELVLLKTGQELPPPQCQPFPKFMTLPCKLKLSAYRFGFELPDSPTGYRVAPWRPLDDLDPNAQPASWPDAFRLEAFATPGEYEPVTFVVYADKAMQGLSVVASDLRGPKGTLPSSRVDVRYVMHCPKRKLYFRPVEEIELVSRFLLKRDAVNLRPQTFRQIYAIVHVPEDAKPGTYSGSLRMQVAGETVETVPLAIEVLPFRLGPPGDHQFGIYYRFAEFTDDVERMSLELADIRAHGGHMLKPNLRIDYVKQGDRFEPDDTHVRKGLDLMRRHGMHGTITIYSGLTKLAPMCGVRYDRDNPPDRMRLFQDAGQRGMQGLIELDKNYPEFDLVATHMDEVLTPSRLPRYTFLAKVIRLVPDMPIYITMHNRPVELTKKLTPELDPYVDIRCYNGHCMEDWLRAGKDFDDLAVELREAGDVAWTYHNIRGTFFPPEWTRLVNSYWLWMSPIEAHVPWMYQHTKGNPLDDTDGPRVRGHDFGYAVTSPEDGKTPIPTRHWEAYREGIDDLRYICTLEALVREAQSKAPEQAVKAQQWLTDLRAKLPELPEDIQDIEDESPLLVWLSRTYGAADYQAWRRRTADEIVALLRAMNRLEE